MGTSNQRVWKKYKKSFSVPVGEQLIRKQLRQHQLIRRLIPLIIFIIIAYIFYHLRHELGQILQSNLQIEFDKNFVVTLISAIAAVISAYFAIFPHQSQENAKFKKKLEDFRHKLPRHYIDVHCQDINPADDAERNPVRQSLREKTWEWLFDPLQSKKSYLLLLGDFGTGKTTFCFYIGQEIIQTMRSLDVKIIELGQEDSPLEEELNTIPLKERGQMVLILDAYDEYKKRGQSENEYNMLLELTHSFYKVLVTSRTNYFAYSEVEPQKLRTCYISYFNEAQVQHFLKRNHPCRWRKQWDILKEYQQFTDLSRRVVLLNYLNLKVLQSIKELKKQGKAMGNYQIYSGIVMDRLPDERNANELLPRTIAIEIMSLFGFHIVCCGGDSQIHYSALGDKLTVLLKEFNLSDSAMVRYLQKGTSLDQYSRLVTEIRTRTFLIRDNPGYYRFAHQSFAEYFAARFILEILFKNKPKNTIKFQIPSMVLTFLEEAGIAATELTRLFDWIQPRYLCLFNSISLSEDQVKNILKKYNFFDSNWNINGTGVFHNYRLVDLSGDQVVLDFATGLMWQKSGSINSMRYKDAKNWITQLKRDGFAGYHDWRLPTTEEAMSIIEPEQKNGALYIDPAFDSQQTWIWTANPVTGTAAGWVVYFYGGYCAEASLLFKYFVRAVRSGKSFIK